MKHTAKAQTIAVLFSLVASLVMAYEPERAKTNQANELAECAAYFMAMADCTEKAKPGDPLVAGLEEASESAIALSAALSNNEAATARFELGTDTIREEMMGDCSNASIVIDKYNAFCKVAMKDPRSRAEYWLNKQD